MENFKSSSGCFEHEFEPIDSSASFDEQAHCSSQYLNWYKRAWHAVIKKWNHPFHWSSLTYAFGIALASTASASMISEKNKAGCYVGDMANLVNAMVIPTGYGFVVFHHWMNLDREEAKRFAQKIEERFLNIQGVLKMAALIVGKMNNGICTSQACGFFKILMLIHWPSNLVEKYIQISSHDSSVSMEDFITELKNIFDKHKILYRDNDIEKAFFMGAIKPECEIDFSL